jgi:hypothetical protein
MAHMQQVKHLHHRYKLRNIGRHILSFEGQISTNENNQGLENMQFM